MYQLGQPHPINVTDFIALAILLLIAGIIVFYYNYDKNKELRESNRKVKRANEQKQKKKIVFTRITGAKIIELDKERKKRKKL